MESRDHEKIDLKRKVEREPGRDVCMCEWPCVKTMGTAA